DDHDLVGGADRGGVEGVEPDPQLGFGMRAALPAGIGERVDRGNAKSTAWAVWAERFAGKVQCRAAAHPARRPPCRCCARTAEGFAERLYRRRAGAGNAVAELHSGEEEADHRPLDRDAVELGAEGL